MNFRSAWAVALVVALVACGGSSDNDPAPHEPAAPQAWDDGTAIGDPFTFCCVYQVALDADRDGNLMVVWRVEEGKTHSFRAVRYDAADGRWSDEAYLGGVGSVSALGTHRVLTDPRPGGDRFLSWLDDEANKIFLRRYDTATRRWDTATEVPALPGGPLQHRAMPAYAMDSAGHLTVLHVSVDGNGDDRLFASVREADSGDWRAPVPITSRRVGIQGLQLALDRHDNQIALWFEDKDCYDDPDFGETCDHSLWTARRERGAGAWSAPRMVDDDVMFDRVGYTQPAAALALAPTGETLLVWSHLATGTMRAVWLDGRGAPLSSPAVLAIPLDNVSMRPQAVIDGQGRVTVIAGPVKGISSVRSDGPSAAWSKASLLYADPTLESKLWADAEGNVTVLLQGAREILARHRPAGSDTWEKTIPVTAPPRGQVESSGLYSTIDARGVVSVIWDLNIDGDDSMMATRSR